MNACPSERNTQKLSRNYSTKESFFVCICKKSCNFAGAVLLEALRTRVDAGRLDVTLRKIGVYLRRLFLII